MDLRAELTNLVFVCKPNTSQPTLTLSPDPRNPGRSPASKVASCVIVAFCNSYLLFPVRDTQRRDSILRVPRLSAAARINRSCHCRNGSVCAILVHLSRRVAIGARCRLDPPSERQRHGCQRLRPDGKALLDPRSGSALHGSVPRGTVSSMGIQVARLQPRSPNLKLSVRRTTSQRSMSNSRPERPQ